MTIRRRTATERAVAYLRRLERPRRKRVRVVTPLKVQVEQEFREAQGLRRRA